MSRRLNIMYNVKIIAFFIITRFAGLYVRVDILLECGMHLHDKSIISLRRVWTLSVITRHSLLKCMYQAGRVFVC